MPKRVLRVGHQALKRVSSRARYLELERRRQELLRRVTIAVVFGVNPKLRRTAITLLNQNFRATNKLAQRASILASAEWVVRLLEAGISTV
jgi:hypothetical protein